VTALAAPVLPAPAAPPRATREGPPRLLAVLTGGDAAVAVLDEAYGSARETGREVHTALLLPRAARDRADDESGLVALAMQRAAAAGLPARITVHRLRGLGGPRRERVLDRAVARLARRLDAVPVGWPLP
jgi:hypothetical protein